MNYQIDTRIEQYKSINREFALKTQELKDQLAAVKFENVLLKQELFDKHEKLVVLINVQNEYAKLKELSIKLIRNCTRDFNKCINELLERFNYTDFPDFHASLSLTKQTSEKIKRQSLVFVQTTVAESEEVFNQLRTSFTSNSSSSTTTASSTRTTTSKNNTTDYYHTDRINLNSSLPEINRIAAESAAIDPVYLPSSPVRHIQFRRGTTNSHRKSNDFKKHNIIPTSNELNTDNTTTNPLNDYNKNVVLPILPTRRNVLAYNNHEDLFHNQNNNKDTNNNNNNSADNNNENDPNTDVNDQADLINYEFINNEMHLNNSLNGSNKRLYNLDTINECTGEYHSINLHSNNESIAKDKLSVNLTNSLKTKQAIVSKSPQRATSLCMPAPFDNDKDTFINESSVNMTLTNVCSSTPYKKLDNKENCQPYTKVSTRSKKKSQTKKTETSILTSNNENCTSPASSSPPPPLPLSSSSSSSTSLTLPTTILKSSSTSIRRHTDRPRRKASASNVCLQEPSARTKLRR